MKNGRNLEQAESKKTFQEMKLEFEKRIIHITTTKDSELNRLKKELEAKEGFTPKYQQSNSSSGSLEDRVRALLVDLETQSRKHITEIQKLHDHY